MLSIDLARTRAVLIGASRFDRDPDNLTPLPGVEANIEDLASILADPSIIGLPSNSIEKILNEENLATILEKLSLASREAKDTLIVYYSGHGLIGTTSHQLYLSTAASTYTDLEFNSISFDNVKKAISGTTATKKILILDCCFSGRALDFMGSEASLLQSNINIEGTFAIASAPSNKPAIAPKDSRHTAFSGKLIRILGEGIDNGKSVVTLKEIYSQIRNELCDESFPEPQQVKIQDADRIIFAKNRNLLVRIEARLNLKIIESESKIRENEEEIKRLKVKVDSLEEKTLQYSSSVGDPLSSEKDNINTNRIFSVRQISSNIIYFLIACFPVSLLLILDGFFSNSSESYWRMINGLGQLFLIAESLLAFLAFMSCTVLGSSSLFKTDPIKLLFGKESDKEKVLRYSLIGFGLLIFIGIIRFPDMLGGIGGATGISQSLSPTP